MHRLTKLAVPIGWLLLIPALPAASLRIPNQELPWAITGISYDAAIQTVSDGRCPANDVTLSLASGALPRGMQVSATGLSGVPRELGLFRFSIRATNGCQSASKELALFVTGRPILQAVPAELVFEYRSGEPAPPPQVVLVSSSWANLPYSIKTGDPWLAFDPATGMTPGPNTAFTGDAVSVRIAPQKLAPGTYKSTLAISAWQAANLPVVSVIVKVIADNSAPLVPREAGQSSRLSPPSP